MEYDRNKLVYQDQPEQIWVLDQQTYGITDAYLDEDAAGEAAAQRAGLPFRALPVTLHRPSLRPVYGGPTLLEALWAEMDAIVERLMSPDGQNEDGGDKFRAEELAWVIAIVTNAYAPSMDLVRAEAMRRYRGEAE